jgi:hypothetical protein
MNVKDTPIEETVCLTQNDKEITKTFRNMKESKGDRQRERAELKGRGGLSMMRPNSRERGLRRT